MKAREPSGESLLSARLARAYPSLSIFSCATLAQELCGIERAQRRHAERCCNGADGGYVRLRKARGSEIDAGAPNGLVREHNERAELLAGERIQRKLLGWNMRLSGLIEAPTHTRITTEGDPRGPVLFLGLQGEQQQTTPI
jgi:hypothetical protein